MVYLLDRDTYLGQHEFQRYLLQFVGLVLLLGAVALRVVYKVYFVVFGADLQKTEYFERDFVVVIFCLIMVQVYFVIRKERKARAFGIRRKQVLQKWLTKSQQENEALTANSASTIAKLKTAIQDQQQNYEHELNELNKWKQRLGARHDQISFDEVRMKNCLKEAGEMIQIMIGATNEWVRMIQVAYFHLKEGSARSKLVDVQLLDGREGTFDMDSLAQIEKRWPSLFFRAGRFRLIQHFAIADCRKVDDGYIIEFLGLKKEQYKVQEDVYKRFNNIVEEWNTVVSRSEYQD